MLRPAVALLALSTLAVAAVPGHAQTDLGIGTCHQALGLDEDTILDCTFFMAAAAAGAPAQAGDAANGDGPECFPGSGRWPTTGPEEDKWTPLYAVNSPYGGSAEMDLETSSGGSMEIGLTWNGWEAKLESEQTVTQGVSMEASNGESKATYQLIRWREVDFYYCDGDWQWHKVRTYWPVDYAPTGVVLRKAGELSPNGDMTDKDDLFFPDWSSPTDTMGINLHFVDRDWSECFDGQGIWFGKESATRAAISMGFGGGFHAGTELSRTDSSLFKYGLPTGCFDIDILGGDASGGTTDRGLAFDYLGPNTDDSGDGGALACGDDLPEGDLAFEAACDGTRGCIASPKDCVDRCEPWLPVVGDLGARPCGTEPCTWVLGGLCDPTCARLAGLVARLVPDLDEGACDGLPRPCLRDCVPDPCSSGIQWGDLDPCQPPEPDPCSGSLRPPTCDGACRAGCGLPTLDLCHAEGHEALGDDPAFRAFCASQASPPRKDAPAFTAEMAARIRQLREAH